MENFFVMQNDIRSEEHWHEGADMFVFWKYHPVLENLGASVGNGARERESWSGVE